MRGKEIVLILVLFLWTQSAPAQMTTGTISGVVKDASGAILPGATVVVKNLEMGISRTLVTDDNGHYAAPNLSLGEFEIEASLLGFQTEVRSGIRLTIGREAIVDFELKVGEITEKVVVTGESSPVDTTSSTIAGLVGDKQIRDLPLNGRSFDELIALQAGAQLHGVTQRATIRTSEYVINGNRTMSNRFLLDGTETSHASIFNNPGSVLGANLGVDALQEFRILMAGYDASYGKRPGGQISMTTRSGTNEFHGLVFHFLRNSALDARNFFDREEVPAFKRNNFGAAFGGPVVRNRTFIFGNYEGIRHRLGLSNIAIVLNEAARRGLLPDSNNPGRLIDVGLSPAVAPYLKLTPLPNGRDFGDGTAELITNPTESLRGDFFVMRLDHSFSDKNSIFGSFLFDDSSLTHPHENGHSAQFRDVHSYVATIQHQRVFSQSLINTARVGFNRGWNVTTNLPTIETDPSLSFVPGQVLGTMTIGGQFQGLAFTPIGAAGVATTIYILNNVQFSDQMTLIRGKHSLRFGAEVNRIQQNVARGNPRGGYSFRNLVDLLRGRPESFGGTAPGTTHPRYWRQTYIGYYFQDDMRLSSNLTLNLGLRHEFSLSPSEKYGRISNYARVPRGLFNIPATEPRVDPPLYENNSLTNFAPRVGFAWNVGGDGRTSVRGSFGVFYDQSNSLYSRFADGNLPFQLSVSLDNPPFPRPDFSQPSNRVPSADSIDRNLDVPTSIQYTLSIQRELTQGLVLTAAYVGSRGYHLLVTGPNNPALPEILPDGKYFIAAGTRRGNPQLGSGTLLYSAADSHFHSLQMSLGQSLRDTFRFSVNYTVSKNIDTSSQVNSVQSANSPATPQNPFDLSADKGISSLHIGQRLAVNFSYALPFGSGKNHLTKGWTSALLGGWELSGITSLSSSVPFTARSGIDRSRLLEGGRADRPNTRAGCSTNPVLGGPDRYFDLSCFELPPVGFFGNVGRNTLGGPVFFNQDFSLIRVIPIRESLSLRFQAECFNIFNRPNFSVPTAIVTAASGNRIQSTVNTSRQIQFGLKILF